MIKTRILYNRSRGQFKVEYKITPYLWNCWTQDSDPEFMPKIYLDYRTAQVRCNEVENEYYKAQAIPDVWKVIPK